MVRNEDTLFDLLPENATVDDVGNFVSDTYSCLGIDLRDLKQLERGLESAQVKKNGNRIPILVISEVVLAYLAPEESDALLQFFAGYSEGTFLFLCHHSTVTRTLMTFSLTVYLSCSSNVHFARAVYSNI